MHAKHTMLERSGLMGGKTYVVQISVSLNADEQNIMQRFGVTRSIEVGERFANIKGVDIIGNIGLETLLRGIEYKFPSLQMASDFVGIVLDGLRHIKRQFSLIAASASMLEKSYDVEITDA